MVSMLWLLVIQLLEKLHYTYSDMKTDGYAYPIAKMKVKFIKPAKIGDILTIKLGIVSIEPTLNIKYTIFNKRFFEKSSRKGRFGHTFEDGTPAGMQIFGENIPRKNA